MEGSTDSVGYDRRKALLIERLEKIHETDTQQPSPSERAKYIYDKLNALDPKPTHWDLVCFCAESLGMLTIELPVTNKFVAQMLQVIYEIHYYGGDLNPTCLPQRPIQQQNQSMTLPSQETQSTNDQTGAKLSSELVIEKSIALVL
jgi:hypothetical protein